MYIATANLTQKIYLIQIHLGRLTDEIKLKWLGKSVPISLN